MNISFHIVTDRPSLAALAPRATVDLSALATAVKPTSKPVTEDSLADLFSSGAAIAVALDDGRIVGTAYLCRLVKCNDYTWRLEHVATLPSHERRGIARTIIRMLYAYGAEKKPDGYCEHTCESFRVGANGLYASLGCKKRDTNVWRYIFSSAA